MSCKIPHTTLEKGSRFLSSQFHPNPQNGQKVALPPLKPTKVVLGCQSTTFPNLLLTSSNKSLSQGMAVTPSLSLKPDTTWWFLIFHPKVSCPFPLFSFYHSFISSNSHQGKSNIAQKDRKGAHTCNNMSSMLYGEDYEPKINNIRNNWLPYNFRWQKHT